MNVTKIFHVLFLFLTVVTMVHADSKYNVGNVGDIDQLEDKKDEWSDRFIDWGFWAVELGLVFGALTMFWKARKFDEAEERNSMKKKGTGLILAVIGLYILKSILTG